MRKLLALTMVLALSSAAFGGDNQPFIQKAAPGQITLDGDLSDWAGTLTTDMFASLGGSANDIKSATLMVRWDAVNIM